MTSTGRVRARPEPRPRGDLLGARLVSCPQPPEPVDGERRIEPQRPRREPRTVAARRHVPGRATTLRPSAPRRPRGGARTLSTSRPRASAAARRGPIGQRKARAGEPGELCSASSRSGNESRDLPERDPALALALERRPSRGRLRLVLAVEDERLVDVVPVGDVEQSRPEVVVLALRERRVVAEAVLVQHRPVDDDRRVEERRREQGRPPHGARAAGHAVDRAEAPVARRGRSSPSRRRRSAPARRRPSVVSSQRGRATSSASMRARYVPDGGVEPDVERAGEAERSVVADDPDTGVVDRADELARRVGRAVVDDDELEVALASGRARSRPPPRSSARRRGLPGRRTRGRGPRRGEGSLRRWPKPLPTCASTSSSRRSTGRTSSSSLLSSLDAQTHRAVRVVIVDQNEDNRVERVLGGHAGLGRPAIALSARSLACPERGAPVAQRRPRRLSRRRLRLRTRSPRARGRAVRGRPGARRPRRTAGRRRRTHGGSLALTRRSGSARRPSSTPRSRTRSFSD